MNPTKCQRVTLFCRNFTRWFLLIFSVLLFIFALLSGMDSFGGGLRGIISNTPNAIPWLILLVLNWVVWKSEVVGSILLVLFAIAAGFFFDGFGDNLFVLFVITIPLFILAILLLMYHICQLRQIRMVAKKSG
jgi:hypothetical protein